jgi:site-specific DNA-methyltransferase (adenine-specific)
MSGAKGKQDWATPPHIVEAVAKQSQIIDAVRHPIDLRLGRWQDALADVTTCDAVICDPPYSARTHEGQRTGSSLRMPTISYDGITSDDAHAFAAHWAPIARRWAVLCCDHMAFRWHEAAWEAQGWLVFAPVIMLRKNPIPRLSGDGPCLAAEFIMVGRPRRRMEKADMGSRSGAYEVEIGNETRSENGNGRSVAGVKPLGLMRAIVRDYSRPGDLIVDPFCGSGTTALAAAMEGRRCITSEEKPEHYAIAKRRLDKGYQPCLLT